MSWGRTWPRCSMCLQIAAQYDLQLQWEFEHLVLGHKKLVNNVSFMSSIVYNILFQSREAKLNNDVAKDLILVLSWGGQDCRLISSHPQVWRRGSSLMPLKSWRQRGRTRWSLLSSSKSSVLIKVAKSKVKQASSPESDLITESWIWLRMITYLNKLLYFCGSS